ncbi:MAG: hypothetical protein EOO91_03310 [Pedobacter sp.]|nr:MAG: hypothetical protein EOO91_03310 [Pedobacter sp.]
MKSYILLIASLFISSFAFAQARQDTTIVYVDEDLNVINREKNAAFIYRSFQKDSTWIINTYNQKKELVKMETYSDASLLFANGLSVEYYKGKPILKGMYSKGRKKGNWITYDTLGNVLKYVNYFAGRLHGESKEYTNEGKLREEGSYDWGAKKGEWKLYHNNGKIASLEVFKGENAGVFSELYFDQLGNPSTKEKIRTPAVFNSNPRGFYEYATKKIATISPNMLNLNGRVEFSFVVDRNGRVGNIKIISHNGNFLKEARVAIISSPKWIPATLFGEAIDSENLLVLTFVK